MRQGLIRSFFLPGCMSGGVCLWRYHTKTFPGRDHDACTSNLCSLLLVQSQAPRAELQSSWNGCIILKDTNKQHCTNFTDSRKWPSPIARVPGFESEAQWITWLHIPFRSLLIWQGPSRLFLLACSESTAEWVPSANQIIETLSTLDCRLPVLVLDGLGAAQNIGQILRTAFHLGNLVCANTGCWWRHTT